MAEGTFAVKPIGIEYICDVCQIGRMVGGELVFSGPMEDRQHAFKHKCTNTACGHEQEFKEKYPLIRYVTVTEPPKPPMQVGRGCDACKEGKMKSTGTMLTSMPPSYQHKCDKCGHVENYTHVYPYPDNQQ